MYFDKDGIIVESSVEQLPGVPWITGLDFGHIILHQPLPVADPDTFGEILNLTQVLSVHEVKVDKVDYHSSMAGAGEIRLHIGDVVVELGDSEDLDGKVTELSGILPELSGLSPVLPMHFPVHIFLSHRQAPVSLPQFSFSSAILLPDPVYFHSYRETTCNLVSALSYYRSFVFVKRDFMELIKTSAV